MRSGSVIALNTRSRGASNSLVIRISRSDGSVTFVLAVLLAVAISFLLVFSFEVAKDIVELIEALVPRASIGLQPLVELPQGPGAKAVDALLRNRMRLHEPGLAEHAEVLRDLRLAKTEPLDDLPDCAWLTPEKLDDLPAVWFGESAQRGLHETYILLQEYSCQGIYSGCEYQEKNRGDHAEDHDVPVVQRPGRRGDEVLRVRLQEREDPERRPDARGNPRTAGEGYERILPDRRAGIHGAERGPAVPVHRGDLALCEL